MNKLSPRELDVARCIAMGLTTTQIMDELCITERTVRNHLTHIYQKLFIHDRSQVALWVWQNNVLAPGSVFRLEVFDREVWFS